MITTTLSKWVCFVMNTQFHQCYCDWSITYANTILLPEDDVEGYCCGDDE